MNLFGKIPTFIFLGLLSFSEIGTKQSQGSALDVQRHPDDNLEHALEVAPSPQKIPGFAPPGKPRGFRVQPNLKPFMKVAQDPPPPKLAINDQKILEGHSIKAITEIVDRIIKVELSDFSVDERKQVQQALDNFVATGKLTDLVNVVDSISLANFPLEISREIYFKKKDNPNEQLLRERRATLYQSLFVEVEKDLKRDFKKLSTENDPKNARVLEKTITKHIATILHQANLLIEVSTGTPVDKPSGKPINN